MTLVSNDAGDTSTGVGARVALVRGLTLSGTDWIDDQELVILSGTTPVPTTKQFIRTNSVIIASTGASGANTGTVTLESGTDTYSSMVAGDNLTRVAIWSTATTLPAYARGLSFIAGKSVNNATFSAYVTPTTPQIFPTVKVFEVTAFEGQSDINLEVPFELAGGTDFEVTSKSSAATVDTNAFFEMVLVDTS